MANQFSTDLKPFTIKTIAAGVETLPRLAVIAVALVLFVGAAHAQTEPCINYTSQPCVLLNDIASMQVYVYSDDGGTDYTPNGFLMGYTGGGGGGGEGAACLSGSTNALYTTTNQVPPLINTFNLSTGLYISTYNVSGSGRVASIVVNGIGSIMYAGQYSTSPPENIIPLIPSATGVTPEPYIPVPLGKQLALGTTIGGLFANDGFYRDTGVNQYQPSGYSLSTPLQFLPFIPGNDCAVFSGTGGGTHCWHVPSGMAFDAAGDLWMNNYDLPNNDVGTFEFAPGGTCGAPVCPLNFTPAYEQPGSGLSPEPIGATVAPLGDPNHPGHIMVGNYIGGTVSYIDPQSCGGSTLTKPWTLGTCTAMLFINRISQGGRPKSVTYPMSCPNPGNSGYIEICKQSNPNYPVTGIFDFTATAPYFSSGSIEVPVGECSGAVEVPSGQVTVTEAPTIGDLVSDVTACSYNEFGECVPDLISWTLPDLYATVPVATGGVSSETLTTFTNYAASPGQLKVCKIAGLGTPVGTEFTFTVTGIPPFQVQAGPPGQGGFCQLVAGTFPVNTPVTIAETPSTTYPLTNATVECNACTYSINLPQYSVTTTIGAGITVASFTNTKSSGGCLICRNPGIE
jgi:hypothetical protein